MGAFAKHPHRYLNEVRLVTRKYSLSTLHFLKFPESNFEVLKPLENSVEVLKILENKLESMKILENKLESLKLQENQPVIMRIISAFMVKNSFFGGSIWQEYLKDFLAGEYGGSNHHEEEDQEGNNSSEIETLTYHVLATYGCFLIMVIDKSWTSLGKHEKAFYTGFKKFVDDCKPLVDSAGNIRCPCKSCRLVLWVSIKHLSDHILKYGFDPSYKTWIHHGEPDLSPPSPVIDNIRQPQMSDMTACLNELSYIPLNNKQNEPTQGDISETSNDPTQAKRNEFEELYASANEELYPGCDYVTRLDFMAKFTYFKAKGYKLSPSYYAIKKTFKMIELGYESIHACVNDCFLFWGDANKDVHFCSVCNTSRWKESNTPGKKVPKKVLRYFLIIPRLQRLYKFSHTVKEITWHAIGKCTEPGKMQHLVDGRAWKDFDTKYSDFAAEPRNVRLGLAADGFNPFGNLSQSYSMWPDIDVYLRPLIDDLKDLWAKSSVETIDVATGLKFNMRAMVLWIINDFPARIMYEIKLSRKLQVFKSLCKLIGLRSVIRIDHQELKKVICEFPNKDMKEEFSGSFGKTPILVNTCVVNGVRFVVHIHDERHTTQNSSICLPGLDREMYYGQLEQILEFSYLSFKTVLFRVKWFDTSNKGRIQNFVIRNNITQIKANEDMARRPPGWKVIEHVSHKKFLNGGVIMVEDDPDVIHVNNSSNLTLSTSLNDLEIVALHIDGQSIDVDAPTDIIHVVDEDGDIIDEEDPIPHDLADSNDEDLVNLDIDDVVNMSAYVARGHGGDGGGDDRPPPYQPNLGGKRAGRLHTRQETQNLGLKAITDKSSPISIRFEVDDRETLTSLGDHAAHWANYLRDLVRELPLHNLSWRQMPQERKARVTQFDLRPHMESDHWPQIYTGIQQHLQNIYNGKKAAPKKDIGFLKRTEL
nr:hypothetical protein [Tanacetum cinerariifolium]